MLQNYSALSQPGSNQYTGHFYSHGGLPGVLGSPSPCLPSLPVLNPWQPISYSLFLLSDNFKVLYKWNPTICSIIPFRWIQAVMCISSLFFSLISPGTEAQQFVNHLLVEEYLGCLHFDSVTNKAVSNAHIQCCMSIKFCFSGISAHGCNCWVT